MLKSQFQGSTFFEILSPPSGNKNNGINNNWLLKGFKKEFESSVRGFVWGFNRTVCKAIFPVDLQGKAQANNLSSANRKAGLIQPVLVLQVHIAPGSQSAFQMELAVSDTANNTFRIHLSTAVRELKTHLLHALVPLAQADIEYNNWMTLCINMTQLMNTLAPEKSFRSLDSILISGTFALRRVFTLKALPCNMAELAAMVPNSFNLPQSEFRSPSFSVSSLQSLASVPNVPKLAKTEYVAKQSKIAFGKHIEPHAAPRNLLKTAPLTVSGKPLQKADSKLSISSVENLAKSKLPVKKSNIPLASKIARQASSVSHSSELASNPSVSSQSLLSNSDQHDLIIESNDFDTELNDFNESKTIGGGLPASVAFDDAAKFDNSSFKAAATESNFHHLNDNDFNESKAIGGVLQASVAFDDAAEFDNSNFKAAATESNLHHLNNDHDYDESIGDGSIASNNNFTFETIENPVVASPDPQNYNQDTAAVLSKLLESVNKLQVASNLAAAEANVKVRAPPQDSDQVALKTPAMPYEPNSELAKSLEQLKELAVKYNVPLKSSSSHGSLFLGDQSATVNNDQTLEHFDGGLLSPTDAKAEVINSATIGEPRNRNEAVNTNIKTTDSPASSTKVGISISESELYEANSDESRSEISNEDDDLVDLEYDEEKGCYYDPTTGKCYEIVI